MKLYDFVRYVVPNGRASDAFVRGRIVAIEDYTDHLGTMRWYHVRWFCGDGKPEDKPIRLLAAEIEVFP